MVLAPSLYAPFVGGVEELTRNIAQCLVVAGDQVEVWTANPEFRPLPESSHIDGIVVRRFDFALPSLSVRNLLSFPPKGWRTLQALRKSYLNFQPDVFHIQCFGPNGTYITALSRMEGVPLVLSMQGETLMDDNNAFAVSTILRTSLRFALRRAEVLTACSDFALRDALKRFGPSGATPRIVSNGVSLFEPAGEPPPGGLPANLVRLVALGRIVENKGFDLLLRAFARIASDHPHTLLQIAGAGTALVSLERLASQLQLEDCVQFLGPLDRAAVVALLNKADLLVVPSRVEPFGIVVLEGWRSSSAVIVTKHGGPVEFVHDGQDALLVDPFDVSSFAEVLDRALSDPSYRERLAHAGRARVCEFAWPTITARYRSLYKDAINIAAERSRHSPSHC